jgi:hypothetical protein
MRHHAPEHQPHVEQLRVEELRREGGAEEAVQTLARRGGRIFRLEADRTLQSQGEGFVGDGDQTGLARKVMIDQTDGHPGRRADAPHRHALVSILFEAA